MFSVERDRHCLSNVLTVPGNDLKDTQQTLNIFMSIFCLELAHSSIIVTHVQ